MIYTNLKRNRIGGINGILESGVESTLSIDECELAEAGEWGVIADYTQAEKDAYLAQQEREQFKSSRADAVLKITVTTAAGNVFDGDETSQTRMARAIAVLDDGENTPWVLHDNTAILATKEELKEALKMAGMAQSDLWVMS